MSIRSIEIPARRQGKSVAAAALIARTLTDKQRRIMLRTPRALPLPARQIADGSFTPMEVAQFVRFHAYLFERYELKRPNGPDRIKYCLRPLGRQVRDVLEATTK